MFSRKIDLRPFGNFSQKNPFSETKIRILRLVTVRFPPPVKKSSADRRAHRFPTHGTKAQRASEGLTDRRKDDGAQKILELTAKELEPKGGRRVGPPHKVDNYRNRRSGVRQPRLRDSRPTEWMPRISGRVPPRFLRTFLQPHRRRKLMQIDNSLGILRNLQHANCG